MRQTAARLNRAWLIILGVLLLLAGLAVLSIATGLLTTLGLGLNQPAPADRLFGDGAAAALGLTWVVLLTAVLAIVVGLLGLAWLLAQIPRANPAKPFRLHDNAETGMTRCQPSVLTDAVEDQVESLPGVERATAVLRGTASAPDLTLKVTASDRTDVPRLLARIQNEVAGDLAGALDTKLQRLGVQVEIDTTRTRSNHITVGL